MKGLGGWIGAGFGLLAYGALFETSKLVSRKRTLKLPHWPEHLAGLNIGLMADLHIRDAETIALARTASTWLVDQNPDIIVIPGDIIAYWKEGVEDMISYALEPLREASCPILAVPGNHDHYGAPAANLKPILNELGIDLLINESRVHHEVNWVGIDSGNAGKPDPYDTILTSDASLPTIVLWHEPDMVDLLPECFELMLSGHSHGGQFRTPWGWAPMKTEHGEKYVSGYYQQAPIPLFVTSGLAVTGPPARLFCPPEVYVLTLE